MQKIFSDVSNITTRHVTDEGFLQADALLSHTGVVNYLASEFSNFQEFGKKNINDVIRVYRPPSVIFADDTLNSFSNKIVTNEHPVQGSVNIDNVKDEQVGHIGENVKRSGNFIRAKLTITDRNAINKIQDGTSGLSVGYLGEIKPESGKTPDGQEFDAVLTSMSGNHVALTSNPRAKDARILDSQKTEVKTMSKVKINDIEVEVNEEAKQPVQTLIDSNASMAEQIKSLKDELKTVNDSKELLAEEVVKLKESLNDEEAIEKMVASKIALVDSIKNYLEEFKPENKSQKEMKIEFVSHFNDSFSAEGKSDEYLDASFETAMVMAKKIKKQELEINDSDPYGDKRINDSVSIDEDDEKEISGYDKLRAYNADAWKH